MKRYFLTVVAGLAFGFASGCFGMWIAFGETLPVPAEDHWYNLAAIFSIPGEVLTWLFFHPRDAYYGDIWDNRNHIVPLNSISWMLMAHLFFCLKHLGDLAMSDWRRMRLMRIVRRQEAIGKTARVERAVPYQEDDGREGRRMGPRGVPSLQNPSTSGGGLI